MLNVETESTKINILSSQLLIFSCVNTDYMLVYYKNKKHVPKKNHIQLKKSCPIPRKSKEKKRGNVNAEEKKGKKKWQLAT